MIIELYNFMISIFDESFWKDFLSNFLATIFGAIIGIPIAIGINNQQQKSSDKLRKGKVVPLLTEELLVNIVQLSDWKKANSQNIEALYSSIFLEDSAWTAFSDSGELVFIQDPVLLKHLSHAYSSIRIVRQLTERYMDLLLLADVEQKNASLHVVATLLIKGIDEAIEDVDKAVREINK